MPGINLHVLHALHGFNEEGLFFNKIGPPVG